MIKTRNTNPLFPLPLPPTMPSSFEDDANNEQLVHGAVETAINEFTGDLHGTNELNFPENFPTDAPQPSAEEEHYEESQEGQLHEHEQYQQLPPQPADGLPEEELYGEAHMSTSAPSEKKSKKQKANVNSGRWTEAEHLAFIQGVEQHGKDCTKIAAMIPSRTTLQVRTHAQK
jgi:SHAQKYF class myb-like DNA-binding protein